MTGTTKSECCTYIFPKLLFMENSSITITSGDRELKFVNDNSIVSLELFKNLNTISFLFSVKEFGGADIILGKEIKLIVGKKIVIIK
jgi:hypothetical protein